MAPIWYGPERVRALTVDPEYTGRDYILDHPDVAQMFQGVTELGNGVVMHSTPASTIVVNQFT
jgi:hypothetical protein